MEGPCGVVAFEASIVEHLVGHGWLEVSRLSSPPVGSGTPMRLSGLWRRQPGGVGQDWWGCMGGRASAVAKVTKRVADEITGAGSMCCVVGKDLGQTIQVGVLRPGPMISPRNRWDLYDLNRLAVTRVHHSESHPQDSVDPMLFINDCRR